MQRLNNKSIIVAFLLKIGKKKVAIRSKNRFESSAHKLIADQQHEFTLCTLYASLIQTDLQQVQQ